MRRAAPASPLASRLRASSTYSSEEEWVSLARVLAASVHDGR
jgi:hypothetical protein